jgi:general L-amino acid transport system permease protein
MTANATRAPEPVRPPDTSTGVVGWLRQNLFRTWLDSLLTVALLAVLGWIAWQLLAWAVTEARWGVITSNLRLFLVGSYPPGEMWRVWLALTMLSALSGLSAALWGAAVRTLANWLAAGQVGLAILAGVSGMGIVPVAALVLNAGVVLVAMVAAGRRSPPRRLLLLGWLLSLPVAWLLLQGLAPNAPLLPFVSTNLWGGLLLTFLLAIVSIALSFPLGVLLALGRRSSLPAIRFLSTAYIEIVRGVPLVTIIFLADIMLPLVLAGDLRIDRVTRAMGGLTIFAAAYLAENVRGGLQAISRGQIEAAQALGLNTIQTNRFIVLPQALRAVIPANVGLFISLLKDTTLVLIVGLLELLGIGRAVLAQSEWLGAQYEVYLFVAVVFFVLCYTMSQASYRLEAALGVGKR